MVEPDRIHFCPYDNCPAYFVKEENLKSHVSAAHTHDLTDFIAGT